MANYKNLIWVFYLIFSALSTSKNEQGNNHCYRSVHVVSWCPLMSPNLTPLTVLVPSFIIASEEWSDNERGNDHCERSVSFPKFSQERSHSHKLTLSLKTTEIAPGPIIETMASYTPISGCSFFPT